MGIIQKQEHENSMGRSFHNLFDPDWFFS